MDGAIKTVRYQLIVSVVVIFFCLYCILLAPIGLGLLAECFDSGTLISHSEVRCLFTWGFGLSPLRQHEFSFIVLFLHFSLSPFSSFDHEVKPNGRPMRAFSCTRRLFWGRAK